MTPKQRKLAEARAAIAKTLERTGYTAMVERHGHRRTTPFPDLSVEQRSAPMGNRLGSGAGNLAPTPELPGDAKQFTVSHFHKQGYQLVTKADAPFVGSKK